MATPFTDFVHLTEASSGAPTLCGVNGSGNDVMNWALTQAGWTRIYHNAGTFESVFQPPAGGSTPCLYVCHNSAISGDARAIEVRMCESATGYAFANLVDPVPTLAQVAHNACNWMASSAANGTARAFAINVWEEGIEYFSNFGGTADVYEMGFMCKPWLRLTSDTYGWAIGQRQLTSFTSGGFLANGVGTTLSTGNAGKVFFLRNYAGTIKSTYASLRASGNGLGSVVGTPSIFAGVGGVPEKEKVCIHCHGASTNVVASNAVPIRACIPNLWSPVHSSLTGATFTDVFTDTAYDATADFKLIRASASFGVFLESTNTSTGFPGA